MLKLENITFSYGMVAALRGISMNMPTGQITCVMGRNGVGKTTLMKNIMGLLKSTGGSVSIDDSDVTRFVASKRAKAGIALVPQGRQIFPKLTIEENLRSRTAGADRRFENDSSRGVRHISCS